MPKQIKPERFQIYKSRFGKKVCIDTGGSFKKFPFRLYENVETPQGKAVVVGVGCTHYCKSTCRHKKHLWVLMSIEEKACIVIDLRTKEEFKKNKITVIK